MRRLLDSNRAEEAGVQLEAMEKAAKRVYADVREEIFSLRTPLSGSEGLADAVRAHLRNYREMPGAPTTLEVVEDGELVVEDDGRGFRPEQRARTGWPHFGLQTMRERAEAIGGRFEIDSNLDRGTTVRVRVPLVQPNGKGE